MLTVTSPASDRSLLTVAELRAAVGISDASQDAVLTALGDRAAASIVRACAVVSVGATPPTLRQETLSETYRLKSHQNCLILSRRPVVTVSSIEVDDVALSATDYEVDASAGLLYRLCGDRIDTWSCGKVVVVYSAGFDVIPDDLKLAASKLVAALWSEGERVDSSLKRESIPGVIDREWWVGPSDDPLIPAEVMDLLSPYRNHWIG